MVAAALKCRNVFIADNVPLEYGQCGIGAFCLGGCDPRHSYALNSCVAAPICKSQTHTFAGLNTVADKTKYLGDASKYEWVVDGTPMNSGNNLLLTMAPDTVGTVMASTRYVWYGKITATMKTSRTAGVVSAFIMMSDMKDEIDFEWVGTELTTTQTNYYFQGIPDYTHSGNISSSDTYANWHTYEIDWQTDQITWSVDGQVGRVLKKSDTYNATSKRYEYPQTPARVQLSLWPGGLASNSPGTIAWAGGEIDWTNTADMKNPGYYYVQVQDVTVECYGPPSDAVIKGSKSYYYNSAAGMESNVVIGDNSTILASFVATGTNMSAKPDSSDANNNAETVPGLVGGGTTAGDRANSTDANSGGDNSVGQGPGSNTFTQGTSGAMAVTLFRGVLLVTLLAGAGMFVL